MQAFRELKVWQKAHTLTLAVYRVTSEFPREEMYGLTAQMRRCCSSIPANIAEGCGRDSGSDFARFLQIAMGSASELEYHLLLAHDLGFMSDDDYVQHSSSVIEIKRMLSAFITRLRTGHQSNGRNVRTELTAES
jgi:four helix bundle protein